MSTFVRLPSGQQVLVGLDWDANPKGYGQTEARMRAKGAKASGFILRGNDGQNLGLVPSAITLPESAISFAAAMADALGANWCGVFHLRDQFVFVAVANGCVLADGDRIYPSESGVRSRFEQELSLYDVLYCPADWGVSGALDSAVAFNDLHWDGAPPIIRIRQAKKVSRSTVLVSAVAMAALFAGYQGWRIYVERKEAEELARRALPPPPPDPWVSRTRAQDAIDACLAAREVLSNTTRQGWELKALSCEFSGGAKVVGTLAPYTANAIQPFLPTQFTTKLSADGTVMEATTLLKVPPVNRRGERPSPVAVLEARNLLLGQPKPATWRQSGRQITFDLTTAAPIQIIGEGLQKIPTASVSKIDLTGENWRVQGDIYN